MTERIVSIEDVANRAGVSISTVSRIVNNTQYPVADATRKKVLKAIAALGYVPNKSAQSLRQEANNLLGLIVRDITDPYFGEIARGVTEQAKKLDLMVFVSSTERDMNTEIQYHDLLWQHRVSGIIVAGGGLDNQAYIEKIRQQLKRADDYGLKLVALAPQGVDMPYVIVDNTDVGRTMGEYLLARGHKQFAYIGGPEIAFTARDRLEGFRKIVKDGGGHLNDIIHTDYSWGQGYQGCVQLIKNGYPFTALACATDNIAIGAMHALKEAGYKIPDDISVVSVGDITQAQYSDPPLTTVRIPRYEMGVKAVELIANHEKLNPDIIVTFKTRIIERKSVKNLSTDD